jgi:hypothetical protein
MPVFSSILRSAFVCSPADGCCAGRRIGLPSNRCADVLRFFPTFSTPGSFPQFEREVVCVKFIGQVPGPHATPGTSSRPLAAGLKRAPRSSDGTPDPCCHVGWFATISPVGSSGSGLLLLVRRAAAWDSSDHPIAAGSGPGRDGAGEANRGRQRPLKFASRLCEIPGADCRRMCDFPQRSFYRPRARVGFPPSLFGVGWTPKGSQASKLGSLSH